jgi:hypothetical protein
MKSATFLLRLEPSVTLAPATLSLPAITGAEKIAPPGSQEHVSTVKKKITKRLISLAVLVISIAQLQLFQSMLEILIPGVALRVSGVER